MQERSGGSLGCFFPFFKPYNKISIAIIIDIVIIITTKMVTIITVISIILFLLYTIKITYFGSFLCSDPFFVFFGLCFCIWQFEG